VKVTNIATHARNRDRSAFLSHWALEADMQRSANARLLGVELTEQVLTDIGYFVD
jgi:hypothetical protein